MGKKHSKQHKKKSWTTELEHRNRSESKKRSKKHKKHKKDQKDQLELVELVDAPEVAPLAIDSFLAALALSKKAVDESQAAVTSLVQYARTAGVTWPQVGRALGVTSQAAQQRYGKRPKPQVEAESEWRESVSV
jgi:hypothetical protein